MEGGNLFRGCGVVLRPGADTSFPPQVSLRCTGPVLQCLRCAASPCAGKITHSFGWNAEDVMNSRGNLQPAEQAHSRKSGQACSRPGRDSLKIPVERQSANPSAVYQKQGDNAEFWVISLLIGE